MPRDRRDLVKTIAGRRAVAEALAAGRVGEVLVAEGAKATEGLRDVLDAARLAGAEVRRVPRSELDRRAPDHHGVVGLLAPGAPGTSGVPRTFGERELAGFPFAEEAVVVVLDGIMDPQNLGAAARACEAAGVAVLVTRVRRAAGPTPAAVRASAGALLHVPLARVTNVTRAIERLKDARFSVVGLDGSAPHSIYDGPCPSGRVAIVIGSEGGGMSRLVRESCDLLVSLPMRGRVGSLNASAALAAVLYAWVLPSRSR
ncbi:MAG: RNA methyltransferase [Actinobacteria bacterium]|nr:RNA methyltransferase [Actinomycetota bacterium]